MATFRYYLNVALFGAIVGLVLASLAAPSLLSSSLCGMTADAMTSRPCVDTVHRTVEGLLRGQGIGALLGASIGVGFGIGWKRRTKIANVPEPKPPVSAP